MVPIDIIRLITGIVILGYASYTDITTRKVKNVLWAFAIPIALVLLGIQMGSEKSSSLAIIPVIIPLILPVFFERGAKTDLRRHVIATPIWIISWTSSLVFITFLMLAEGIDLEILQIPLLILLIYGLWYSGILFGGGDAKAMIFVILLSPFYPEEPIATLHTPFRLFPFPVVVLTNAMIFFLFIPLVFALFNASRRDFGIPEMFFGFRMNVKKARSSFVWPMEQIVDGKHIMILFPRRSMDVEPEFEKLQKAGINSVWVTPKIPFIVPLCAGYVIAHLIGDVLLWLVVMML